MDASNYLDVIARAKELYAAGTRHLLLDLHGLSFMSSAGLMALHSIALIMQSQKPPDPEHGWSAFRAVERDLEGGKATNCKILNPQPAVSESLEVTLRLALASSVIRVAPVRGRLRVALPVAGCHTLLVAPVPGASGVRPDPFLAVTRCS